MIKMELLLWSIIIVCFILGFVGLVYPIIPSVPLIWAGFGVYPLFIDPKGLSLFFWIFMGLLSVMVFFVEFLANNHFVEKKGGSKWSKRTGTFGLITGAIFFPPLGILIFPFVFVFITEYILHKDLKECLDIALGTVVGFISSTIAKFFIQLVMVIGFFIAVAI
jgi:uncharacterized protein YqgC (DUF456 family)